MAKKKETRKKNYRIPFRRDKRSGQAEFPTIEVLFQFVQEVLKDVVQEERDENIFDSEVARFIYPGYPYAHQFKRGLKNVSHVIELSLLARNLGVPVEWLQNIRRGEWTLRDAMAAYQARKDGAVLCAEAEHLGELGSLKIRIQLNEQDPVRFGDAYATAIQALRPVVSEGRGSRRQGSFI